MVPHMFRARRPRCWSVEPAVIRAAAGWSLIGQRKRSSSTTNVFWDERSLLVLPPIQNFNAYLAGVHYHPSETSRQHPAKPACSQQRTQSVRQQFFSSCAICEKEPTIRAVLYRIVTVEAGRISAQFSISVLIKAEVLSASQFPGVF